MLQRGRRRGSLTRKENDASRRGFVRNHHAPAGPLLARLHGRVPFRLLSRRQRRRRRRSDPASLASLLRHQLLRHSAPSLRLHRRPEGRAERRRERPGRRRSFDGRARIMRAARSPSQISKFWSLSNRGGQRVVVEKKLDSHFSPTSPESQNLNGGRDRSSASKTPLPVKRSGTGRGKVRGRSPKR